MSKRVIVVVLRVDVAIYPLWLPRTFESDAAVGGAGDPSIRARTFPDLDIEGHITWPQGTSIV